MQERIEKEEFSKEYAELYCLYSYTKITHSGFTCTPLASFGQSGEYWCPTVGMTQNNSSPSANSNWVFGNFIFMRLILSFFSTCVTFLYSLKQNLARAFLVQPHPCPKVPIWWNHAVRRPFLLWLNSFLKSAWNSWKLLYLLTFIDFNYTSINYIR